MSGWGCCPLACRHGRVCVGRVVVLLVILRMFHQFLELVCGVIVTCCLECMLAFIVSGVIKLLLSSPFFQNLEKKNENKKKFALLFACCRNDGVVTYGIRVGSTLRLWIARLSTVVNP
jgi:hypothetical protein